MMNVEALRKHLRVVGQKAANVKSAEKRLENAEAEYKKAQEQLAILAAGGTIEEAAPEPDAGDQETA